MDLELVLSSLYRITGYRLMMSTSALLHAISVDRQSSGEMESIYSISARAATHLRASPGFWLSSSKSLQELSSLGKFCLPKKELKPIVMRGPPFSLVLSLPSISISFCIIDGGIMTAPESRGPLKKLDPVVMIS